MLEIKNWREFGELCNNNSDLRAALKDFYQFFDAIKSCRSCQKKKRIWVRYLIPLYKDVFNNLDLIDKIKNNFKDIEFYCDGKLILKI